MAKTKKGDDSKKELPPESESQQGEFTINAQYIKDLSFENPGPIENLIQQEAPSTTLVNIEVGAQHITEQTFEVTLKVKAHVQRNEKTVYLIELEYAGIFTLAGLPEEMMKLFLFVECPRQLFPFARAILARLTQESGFPPLLLKPIDFGELLRQRLSEEEAAAKQHHKSSSKKKTEEHL